MTKALATLLGIIFFAIIIVSSTAPLVNASSIQSTIHDKSWILKPINELENLGESLVSVSIVIDKSTPASAVQELYNSAKQVKFTYYNHEYSIVMSNLVKDKEGNYIFKIFGPAKKISDLVKATSLPINRISVKPLANLMSKQPPQPIDIPRFARKTLSVENVSINPKEIKPTNLFARIITGADAVNTYFNITGKDVVIAIVDTGIDYGHPDLQSKLIYWTGYYYDLDGNLTLIREPLVFDPDESEVILLKNFTANATGYINVTGVDFTVLEPWPYDLYAPVDVYYVGNITSLSGVYKLGVTDMPLPTPNGLSWINVGVLMTDPITPGNYTDLYIDINNNGNFTDPEDIHVTYDGDRILVSPNATSPEISLGVAGGFFYDRYWWFNYPGRIYPGWDLKGRYISIFFDFYGHGTSCASAAAGSGSVFQGIAPDAKVIGIKGLWVGEVELGMLWAAGFDVSPYGTVYYTGDKRADIISNSWGISTFIYDISGFGYDFESMFVNALTVPGYLDPDFPGIVIVQAAGNGGGGFGTVTAPGAAAGVITVGASTSTWTDWYFYGFGGFTYDEIVSWSARGPTPAGYLKPDVVNIGAWGITAAPVGWGNGATYEVFGGTSYATPLTAGAVALIYEALYKVLGSNATLVSPAEIKHILMSSADNLDYPPFDEGAGRVNVFRAVENILYGPVDLIISSTSYYDNTYGKLKNMWYWYMADNIPYYFYHWVGVYFIPSNPYIPENWKGQPYYGVYVPDILQGSVGTFNLTITNPFSSSVRVSLEPVKFYRMSRGIKKKFYMSLDSYQYYTSEWIVIPRNKIPRNAKLLQAEVNMPFKFFDGDGDYYSDYEVWVFAYVWINDTDADGYPDMDERAPINWGYSSSNYNKIQISDPLELLDEFGPNATLLIRPILIRGLDYSPASEAVYDVKVTVTITYFGAMKDTSIHLYPATRTIRAGDTLLVKGIIRTGLFTTPTVYQDYIKVTATLPTGETRTYYVPLTYTVATKLMGDFTKYLNNQNDITREYTAAYIKGENDWYWRYEAGDWRFFYVDVEDPYIMAFEVKAQWSYANTSLITYTLGPDGQFAGAFYGGSVSYHYHIRSGRFQWFATGGYAGLNKSVITFPSTRYRYGLYPTPKPNLGVYTVIVRTALFDGSTNLERFKVSIRGIRSAIKLPNTPQPSTGWHLLKIKFPYKTIGIYAYNITSQYPILTSQIFSLRVYNTTPQYYIGYFKPNTWFEFNLTWNDTGVAPELRQDISVVFIVVTPEDNLGLPVYYRYGSNYYLYANVYPLEDWVITGETYYWWFYGGII